MVISSLYFSTFAWLSSKQSTMIIVCWLLCFTTGYYLVGWIWKLGSIGFSFFLSRFPRLRFVLCILWILILLMMFFHAKTHLAALALMKKIILHGKSPPILLSKFIYRVFYKLYQKDFPLFFMIINHDYIKNYFWKMQLKR